MIQWYHDVEIGKGAGLESIDSRLTCKWYVNTTNEMHLSDRIYLNEFIFAPNAQVLWLNESHRSRTIAGDGADGHIFSTFVGENLGLCHFL